jgi:hypothetical protein
MVKRDLFGVLPMAGLCAALVGALSASVPSSDAVELDLKHGFARGFGYGSDQHRDIAFGIDAPPVQGLYPGAVKSFKLVVSNPYAYDLRITGIWASLRSTSRRGCAPLSTNLAIRPYSGPPSLPLVVPAHRRRAAGSIAVYMPNTVSDACQRTTFSIQFQGSGTKAHS